MIKIIVPLAPEGGADNLLNIRWVLARRDFCP
jgi:hypothetical protein